MQKQIILIISVITVLVLTMSLTNGTTAAAGEYEEYWQRHYEKAVHLNDVNPDSLANNYRLAITMANQGMIQETMELLEGFEEDFSKARFNEMYHRELKKIDKSSDKLLYLNYQAFYHVIYDEYEAAIAVFDDIIRIDEDNIWPLNYQAAAYIELDKNKEAELILKRSLSIQRNDYTHLLLGITYYQQGSTIKALNQLRKSGSTFKDFVF
ncbi:MAG: tetratricopeptide repeat protein [Bacillota bacterium]